MILAKRLKGKAIAAWLGPSGDAARRAVSRARQRLTHAPRRLDFYLDLADPISYLTAQAVARLVEVYPVELAVHVITPPASDVDPAPTLREAHAVRDARELAAYWDVEFPATRPADPGLLRDVGTAMIRERPAAEQLRAALDLLGAMWSHDKKRLGPQLVALGTESAGQIAPLLNANYAQLRKAGHYQGAMLRYADTWYWGIDRLPFLEAALADDLGVPLTHVVAPRPEAERGARPLAATPLSCELWFSFRSPYSYLAISTIEEQLAPFGVPVVAKAIPPMVSRGLPLPSVKRLYIVRDAKRCADQLGVPFGELCDPLGPAVDHCLAIAHWAAPRGQVLAFARSAMRGIWAEARDLSSYVDLRYVVERAGLPWAEAKAALGDPEAAKAAAAHAADLAVYGLWGVPSIRCGDFIAWGQDRLPLLVDRLRRHALAAATAAPPSPT